VASEIVADPRMWPAGCHGRRAVPDLARLVVGDGDQPADRPSRGVLVVERQRPGVLRPAVLECVPRLFFEEVGAVQQHDLRECCRRCGREHLPGEALVAQARQVAAVVQVGVRQRYAVEAIGVQGQGLPVAVP